MPKTYEADLTNVGNGKFVIVVARFNDFITGNLLKGALHTLAKHGVDVEENVQVFWVPGAFELPYMVKHLGEKFAPDGVIALGCVIRGGTPHFDYVSTAATLGLEAVARELGLPVAFGVLTTDDVEQAKVRSSMEPPVPSEPFTKPAPENKGVEAALTALQMHSLSVM
jgi:6,7-dimethyl-8-ribityllumazine synthase